MTTKIQLAFLAVFIVAAVSRAETPANLRDQNLVAWCIVPFDGKNRGPAERAAMVKRLGLRRVAYDWRQKHVPTFEQEILEYKMHGIEYFAFWGIHDEAFKLFEKHKLRPQIWQTFRAAGATDAAKLESAVKSLIPLAKQTAAMRCRLGLYNHGGWGGEPKNMVAVSQRLRKLGFPHVGIVYNLHHAHNHLDDFAASLALLKPYLLCLNLNGMTRNGDERGQKILPLGEGEFDVKLLATIRKSGYDGPVGIIGHTQDDVELRLRDNLDGLHWILPQLEGKPAGRKPVLRTWPPKRAQTGQHVAGTLKSGRAEYRQPPISVECRVALDDAKQYNILVASDTKQSGAHWEIFSMAGSGLLTAYLPGSNPDHVRSHAMICDGKPHTVAMIYEPQRVRLLVDGKQVADEKIASRRKPVVPGRLGIGRLVEGGLGCRGSIRWVRISRGLREISETPAGTGPIEVKKDKETLFLWRSPARQSSASGREVPQYSPQLVSKLVEQSRQGDPHRGLLVFASAKSACLSCHRIGRHGGSVGPELTSIAKQRKPAELVESILWSKRTVKPEFVAHQIVDSGGRLYQGYVVRKDARQLVLRDPTKAGSGNVTLALDDIELDREVGTLMPDNLTAALSGEQLADLLRFVTTLGTSDGMSAGEIDALATHVHGHLHGAAKFPFDRRPLNPEHWPNWQHHVNRDRIYDFYAKQADYFRTQAKAATLLPEFPGLDGGTLGHWGNQNDTVWADNRWNQTQLGSLQCGIFRAQGTTVPRGVCLRLGDHGTWAACFDPDTLSYDAVWSGGFVKFSSRRRGFLGGLESDGKAASRPDAEKPQQPFRYRGFYRAGKRVIFSYRLGETDMLDTATVEDGRLRRVVAPADRHPAQPSMAQFPAQWPQQIETRIEFGTNKPYAVETIGLPVDNPWRALLFCSGHAFLPDGSALVCTMQGDVWRVSGFSYPSRTAQWRRFAAGLSQPQGIVADEDGIFVLGRDQITRLHDLNDDGEADFYECFSNAYQTSPAGHDFICGLERDAAGNFYTASGNQGLLRISADGQRVDVIATGFRNPDGLGLLPDGTLTVPCSEGSWTPASMICAVQPPGENASAAAAPPHFGYRGPRDGRVPELPLAYLPRGLDNSSGGQAYVASEKWGPLAGQLLHFSFGSGTHFLVLRDKVDDQVQGAVVPLAGEFRSGAHRGRFHPADGQLYVTGMQGWGSYTPDDGCFERVRFAASAAQNDSPKPATSGAVQLPTAFHVHQNGVAITFSAPLDAAAASRAENHFAQCWNYRYGPGYGSPEFSSRHSGMRGHDRLAIRSTHVLADGRTLFVELPDLQPVNQLHLRLQSKVGQFHDLFVTVHKLDGPFTGLPDYQPVRKTVRPHPIVADLAMATRSVKNPHRAKLKGARPIEIATAGNLSYQTRSFRVTAGEPIALTLTNPDVVPHNWALLKPGTLERVGLLSNQLISDPEAALRHYTPQSSDVLAYTNVVLPRDEFTIYFHAPKQPGRYPYLCTFPGHWKVMNGVMIVE